jgi:hypothetical protein
MLPIDFRIDRAQRLLRMIEQDAPLRAVRLAPLSQERRKSAESYARQLAALTRAEIRKLQQEKALNEIFEMGPLAAD